MSRTRCLCITSAMPYRQAPKATIQPPGIEPETSVWQTESLPLAYGCAIICRILIQPPGIEPETSAWKADSLPLAYGCTVFAMIILFYYMEFKKTNKNK